ncbi:hypothetical protein R1T16_18155 [Flavobacterium sp. DG1-102-2]|uniref:hypothetical protein n=1 Tax=Flavobacterium sp. DG1-102-2 TaxID=3081663 RepID=UPI00294A6E62|nr:hypothetical protein [Flavobacterium sp. DG1-102-2]MDV6170364.1 hypothetical protein [Flavobacterium sp. DG1-102-2]
MNFKTRLSYNNRVIFVYKNGETKQTPFTEVSFFGDNYILAKSETNTFYTVLDLNGDQNDEHDIVHRFQNGLLLVYKPFAKKYKSSDNVEYSINYNVYSILNYDTGKQYIIGIIQSDEIKQEEEISIFGSKYSKTIIMHFLNKPLYCFKDFIFSEILDNQFVVTGSPLMANPLQIAPGIEGYPDFDSYKDRKVWSVVDVFTQKSHAEQTDIINSTYSGLTFKETELKLMDVITMPELPETEVSLNGALYKDLKTQYNIFKSWKKKNKWQLMINNVLSFKRN